MFMLPARGASAVPDRFVAGREAAWRDVCGRAGPPEGGTQFYLTQDGLDLRGDLCPKFWLPGTPERLSEHAHCQTSVASSRVKPSLPLSAMGGLRIFLWHATSKPRLECDATLLGHRAHSFPLCWRSSGAPGELRAQSSSLVLTAGGRRTLEQGNRCSTRCSPQLRSVGVCSLRFLGLGAVPARCCEQNTRWNRNSWLS